MVYLHIMYFHILAMAEAPPVADKGLKDLKDEITCPVCHDFFEEPKILPCCHYYCKECIKGLVNYAGLNRPFECPECRLPTLVPQNDPNQLTTAFFVNRLKELHGKMEKAHRKVEAPCEQCHGGVSVAFCRQCAEFICEKCVESHQQIKVFTGHKVVTLEELKKGGAKQILVSKPPPPKCPIHDEPMKAYCYDCRRLICRDCIVINHAGHKSEFTKLAASESKKQLAEHLEPLKEVQANLYKAAEVVQFTKSEVLAQEVSVTKNIEQSFQQLHEILEQHKKRLLVEATKKVKEKVSYLSVQEKHLSTSLAVIQNLVESVEQNWENATDEELITIHQQILSQIDKETEEHCKRAIDLEPVEEADMGLEIEIVDLLEKACKDRAKVITLPADPSKCKVDGPALNSAELNQQTHVMVHTMLPNGTPTKKPQKVTAELKSLVNGFVTRLKGVRKQGNTYEIQFSSAVRGRHQLAVSVNNQPIAGSTFPVYVKIPPTQLGKPVRVLGGLDGPYGVAVNSAKEVLVTEHKKIVVFNKKGRKVRDIKMPNVDLKGIAVDRDDSIYVSDYNRHCLVKLNKDGKVLKTIGTKGNGNAEFNIPRHVTVTRDQVIVCDSINERLQVFAKENLSFVRTISLQGREPVGIAHDELGNLYVSDPKSSSIVILNKRGEFQLSFNKKANGQLNRPNGVCVVDQFVYVVECGGHCVSVFGRDGQFITSFCKGGNKEGEFNSPFGICVDCDGFVYVCDYYNSRVQVFNF